MVGFLVLFKNIALCRYYSTKRRLLWKKEQGVQLFILSYMGIDPHGCKERRNTIVV